MSRACYGRHFAQLTARSEHLEQAQHIAKRLDQLSQWLINNKRSDWSTNFTDSLGKQQFCLGFFGALGSDSAL